jgi:hypothetical protein
MKSVIFTYTSRARGQEGEASTNILLEDAQAAAVKAAYDNRKGSSEISDILLRVKVDDLCAASETLRGRRYVHDSIKTVEVREV